MAYTNAELRKLLAKATRVLYYEGQQWEPALLGKPTGASTWIFDPPGYTGWKYVRILKGSGISVTKALNTAGVANTGDLEIFVGLNIENQLEIKGLRRQGFS